MKIIKKSLILLSAIPLLASCGLPNWKTNSFNRELNEDEKSALLRKVLAASSKELNKVNYSEATKFTSKNYKTSESTKKTTEIFKKGEFSRVSQTEGKEEMYNGAIESSKSTTIERCALFDEANHKYATVTEEDLTKTYSYSEEESESKEKTVVASNLKTIYNKVKGASVKAVENKKDEYYFTESTLTENFSPQNYEGSAPKEVHTRTRTQLNCYLNEDFSFKSLSYVQIIESNKDQLTGEISNKMSPYYERRYEYTLSYGERKDSPSDFEAIRTDAKKGYCIDKSVVTTLMATAYDENGVELISMPLEKFEEKQLAFSKYHYSFGTTSKIVIGTIKTVKFNFSGSSISNAKPGTPVVFDKEVKVNTLNAGNTGVTLSGGVIQVGVCDLERIVLSFDAEANSSGVAISNVVGSAYAYYSNSF